jgi:hypothetical protein
MSLTAYIPFTDARRLRLMRRGWQHLAAGHDGLALVEWEDGSKTPKPVDWNSELSCLETDDGKRYFARGRGGDPKMLLGVPVWDVNAAQLGVVATEASLLADREEYGEVYEGDAATAQLDAWEQGAGNGAADGDGGGVDGEPEAVADGGFASPDSAEGSLYNLNPPRAFDGEAVSIALPMEYDPFPASQRDAEQAVTAAKQAAADTGEKLIWLALGAGIAAGMWALMTIVPWLMRQIGDSVQPSDVSDTVSSGTIAVPVDAVLAQTATVVSALPTFLAGVL